MDRTGKLVIVFSLLGVFNLYAISLFLAPPYVPLDKIAEHEGSLIRTKGIITDLSHTETGNILMIIRNNQTELLIFVDSSDTRASLSNLSYGDEVDVEGKVHVYRGEYELVASESAIKKVVAHKRALLFVSEIATHPKMYEGRMIHIVGYIDKVYREVFYLSDEGGTYHMRVKRNDISISKLREGDKIIAEGLLSYDPLNMRYELNLIGLEHCE
jgi:DNA/RNA endonuclease YhcR with UshA esterase domain